MSLALQQRRVLLGTPAGWIACGLGSGLAPFAPGTFGSAAALLPYLALRQLPAWLAFAVMATVFALGVWASARVSQRLQLQDAGCIVIDEWVGQWLALLLVEIVARTWPGEFVAPSLPGLLLLGFAAFRLCDILKPWPASLADRRVHGGLGVMLDDAIAGVWAAVVALALLALFRLV